MPCLRYPHNRPPQNLVAALESHGFDINKGVHHYQNDAETAWVQQPFRLDDLKHLRFVGVRMFCKPKVSA